MKDSIILMLLFCSKYGLVAKNVAEVKLEKSENYKTAYNRKRGEKAVREVDI